jgi:hypothetical protein
MADSTQNTQQDQGTQAQAPATDATPPKLYATKDEAEAAKPADAPKSLKPFEVTKGGAAVGWVLARGYDHGLATVARIDGYAVSTGKAAAPVTKDAVAGFLASMSDDERAALIAQYVPVPAPAPAGRGKKGQQ